MAPIKFEKHIKDRLEKRTIEPSKNAWNKLSEKLDAQEESSKNPVAWWLGLAASLVGVFLVTTLFFKNGENKTVLPTLVDSPINDDMILQEEVPEINVIVENENETSEENIKFSSSYKNVLPKQNNNSKTIRNVSLKTKSEVVVYNVIKQKTIENKEVVSSNQKFSNVNNQAIVTQISELEKEEDLVTDSEIESLLENAQNDLLKNKIKTENTIAIDANSLLQDIETDLEQSFRDKMFNTLISGYNTLKTAVAERND